MHCPKCERVIPLISAERLFAYYLARKCPDCSCEYRVHVPFIVIVFLVVLAITAVAIIGQGAFIIGIFIGLLSHIWAKLIPIEKT